MKIEFDTENLSALDLRLLALVVQNSPEGVVVSGPLPEPPSEAAVEALKAEVAMDDFEAAVAADMAEPEPPTMSDAVAAATQLVSTGEAKKVKAALAAVGANRVSEISPDDISAFMEALK